MSEKLYLHQNFTDFMIDVHILFRYVNMPDVTASYETFLETTVYVCSAVSSPNFNKVC